MKSWNDSTELFISLNVVANTVKCVRLRMTSRVCTSPN